MKREEGNVFGLRLICVICEICGSASDCLVAAGRLRRLTATLGLVIAADSRILTVFVSRRAGVTPVGLAGLDRRQHCPPGVADRFGARHDTEQRVQ